MIQKILGIRNLGLLYDACASGATVLGRVTIIYADNGRGKSTLASMMRACHLADAGRLNARKTIDSVNPPEVSLLLDGARVEFKANAWTGTTPAIAVFDSEFVETNVYSGFEVRTDQRKSLLDFALGDQTVKLSQRIEQLTQAIKEQTRNRADIEKILTGFALPYDVADFIALQPVADAQGQIDALRKRIEAIKNAQQLSTRQNPGELQIIQFDNKSIFEVLGKTLADVERSAETVVKAHLARHAQSGLEVWVSNGQAFRKDNECPFCGQEVVGLDLINSYKSYFNKAYVELKSEVAHVEDTIKTSLHDAQIAALGSVMSINAARIEAWKDQIALEIPTLDTAHLRSILQNARTTLLDLVAEKKQQPLTPFGNQNDETEIKEAVTTINDAVTTYNAEITAITMMITEFKSTLESEKVKTLEASIERLQATQRRQQSDVLSAMNARDQAEIERKRLDGEKARFREEADVRMKSILEQYQASINEFLSTSGAEFSIEHCKPTYVGGGEPRTEYALSLRGESVKLGSRTDFATGHSFGTALSEADKRTLAFAFFIARLKTDAKLSETIVVLDDPVSSLDRNRRRHSARLIAQIATECNQLIILSHDPYFVREMRDRLADYTPTPLPHKLVSLKRVDHGYSAFAACDIDDMCSSDYYRHYTMITKFVDGNPTSSSRDIAKAIRPLLEGYYHRRFPGQIPRRLLFGQIISLAVDNATTGPLTNLRPLAQELREINDYAGQFHHDTNQSDDTIQVVDSELHSFARRALRLIHQNG